MESVASETPDARESAPPRFGPGGSDPRDPTILLRDLISVSDLFEARLRRHLTVNQTDLEAMEHLLSSGPLGPSELARRLEISTASATVMIDRLVDLGHVHRERHPTDRRGILVVPSEQSAVKAMSVLRPMIADIDAVLDEYTEDEQRLIADYLRRVVDTYREHAQPQGE